MTTLVRPYISVDWNRWTSIWAALKHLWAWFIIRLPMWALGLPAAWGVFHYQRLHGLPYEFALIAGIAFEITYIALVSIADQLLDTDKRYTQWLWWILNGISVFASALFGTLAHTPNGLYEQMSWEGLTAAAPLPVMGFLYNLLVHEIIARGNRERIAQEKIQKERQAELDALAHRQLLEERSKPFVCQCGMRYETKRQLSNHGRTCKQYQR